MAHIRVCKGIERAEERGQAVDTEETANTGDPYKGDLEEAVERARPCHT